MVSGKKNEGFSGMLGRVRLVDLAQVASLGDMSADLEIHSALGSGLINIRSGQICNSETGALAGEEALREILSWPSGSFEFKIEQTQIRQSIQKSWEQLLLESILHRIEVEPRSLGLESGFSGEIDGMDLLDLVQLACLSKVHRLLRVQTPEGSGIILLNERGIFHAECGSNKGESAFCEMALAKQGTFESSPLEEEEPVTIARPWEDVLVEAKKHRDENNWGGNNTGGLTFLQHLQRMKVAEKIRLALMGNKESRVLLSRDSNRMVQLAVVSNPKLTESEVTLLASSKNTNEEVLRRIGASREWMRLHQVRVALVNNPKCPIGVSSKVIETLGQQDWKRIATSKSVPSVISSIAKRLLHKKT